MKFGKLDIRQLALACAPIPLDWTRLADLFPRHGAIFAERNEAEVFEDARHALLQVERVKVQTRRATSQQLFRAKLRRTE